MNAHAHIYFEKPKAPGSASLLCHAAGTVSFVGTLTVRQSANRAAHGLRLACTMTCLLLLSGCGSFSIMPKFDKAKGVRSKFLYNDAEHIAERLFTPDSYNKTQLDIQRENFITALSDHFNGSNPAAKAEALRKAQFIRDQSVADLLILSDFVYNAEKDQLFKGKGTVDTGFKVLDLAITGTAASFGSTSTKSALAAAATFLTGSKLAMDENFYANQTLATLITTMDGARAEARALLEKKLQLPADQFGLPAAIQEIRTYHRAGSLIDAVIALGQTAASQAETKKQALKSVQEASVTAKTNAAASAPVPLPIAPGP